MFDRFSVHAKQALTHARQEALQLRQDGIAPEHMLLGLLRVPTCSACKQLAALGVPADDLRAAMLQVLAHGVLDGDPPQMPFSPDAKRVLEAMWHAATAAGASHFGTEHLLHALTVVAGTTAQQVLAKLGVHASALQDLTAALPAAERHHVRLLLISNSTMHGGGYLAHCAADLRDFLGAKKKVLFVPYALHDHDGYAAKAAAAFAAFGHDLVSTHTQQHSPDAVRDADAVFVGGGNTFRLLTSLYHYGLFAAIRDRALQGMPYIGSSAGTNVATLSIRTTNDMPIVQPPSFQALALVPFQINPHYLDADPNSTHMGETREQRLQQFHEEHDTPVLGMREGCLLRVEGERAELRGTTKARLFQRGQAPVEYTPPSDLSFLLRDG